MNKQIFSVFHKGERLMIRFYSDFAQILLEHLQTSHKKIILYGMGDGAEKIMSLLETVGLHPAAFMASDDFVRGQTFRGFTVKTLAQIETEFGEIIILICFGTARPDVLSHIYEIAEKHEVYAPYVPVVGGGVFDRKFIDDNKDDIEKAYKLLADERSKSVFESILNYRLSGKIGFLTSSHSDRSEVFKLLSLGSDETYVDLGAYNGDTIEEFIGETAGQFKKIYALEPDFKNYAKMRRRLYMLNPTVFTAINAGAWSEDTELEFSTRGGRNSKVGSGRKIRMKSVDSLLGGAEATYIKLDVEGSEREALAGAAKTIKQFRPKLCVSVYHRIDDIFALILEINKLRPDYRLYLIRSEYIPDWDTNLICI